jgi:hypothetical protein
VQPLELLPGPVDTACTIITGGMGSAGIAPGAEGLIRCHIDTAVDKSVVTICRRDEQVERRRMRERRRLAALSVNAPTRSCVSGRPAVPSPIKNWRALERFDCFWRIAMSQETTTRPRVLIDLALQGVGSHGAFT